MSITLNVNSVTYDGFTSVKVNRSLVNLSSGFSFNAVSSTNIAFPVEVGQSCIVYVNKTPVITGYVEKITITNNISEHSLSIEGRDKTSDLIDSTIGSTVIYNPPITLEKATKNALTTLGLSDIKVISKVSLKPFSVGEIQSAKIGETYFSFLDKLAKLRQVILTTDGEGNIVITQSSTTKINTVLSSALNGINNNIKSSSSIFDYTKRFSKYKAFSQGNALAYIDNPQTPKDLVSQTGETSEDATVRNSRQYNFISDKSANNGDLKKRAIWEANIRRAQSKIYSCTVEGHTAKADNIVWQPNLLVQINDDFSNTKGLFLLKEVTYNLTLDGASTSELSFVVDDAFSLQAEQDARDAKANIQGLGYVV